MATPPCFNATFNGKIFDISPFHLICFFDWEHKLCKTVKPKDILRAFVITATTLHDTTSQMLQKRLDKEHKQNYFCWYNNDTSSNIAEHITVDLFSLKPDCRNEVIRDVCCESIIIRSNNLPKILCNCTIIVYA